MKYKTGSSKAGAAFVCPHLYVYYAGVQFLFLYAV